MHHMGTTINKSIDGCDGFDVGVGIVVGGPVGVIVMVQKLNDNDGLKMYSYGMKKQFLLTAYYRLKN